MSSLSTVGRCQCGRLKLSCLRCRGNATLASTSRDDREREVTEIKEEREDNGIVREKVEKREEVRKKEELEEDSTKRIRKIKGKVKVKGKGTLPQEDLTDYLSKLNRRLTKSPLPLPTLKTHLSHLWILSRHLLLPSPSPSSTPTLTQDQTVTLLRTYSKLARSLPFLSSSKSSLHPLSNNSETLASATRFRKKVGRRLVSLLEVLRPSREERSSAEFAALHLDGLALMEELPSVPSRFRSEGEEEESSAQEDLRRIFLPSTGKNPSPEKLFAIYQRSRLTISWLLESWETNKDGPEQALQLLCQWQRSDLFEPFTLSDGSREQAKPELLRRIEILNERNHGDVLRRQYATLLGRLSPSPSAFLRRRSTGQAFIGLHLIHHLSLSESPIEALKIWDYLIDNAIPIDSKKLSEAGASLIEGLRRGHFAKDANRVVEELEDLAFGDRSSSSERMSRAIAKNAADQGKVAETMRAIKEVKSEEEGNLEQVAMRMRALAEKVDTRMVRVVFDQAEGERKKASKEDQVRLWSELVRAYSRVDNVEKAEEALSTLEKEGLFPSTKLLNSLLFAYAARTDVDKTYELFNRFDTFHSSIRPDVASYAALVALHSNLMDPEAAERVIRSMTAIGLQPNLKIWTSLMDCYVETSQFDKALDLFAFLDSNELVALRPDTPAVNVLFKCFVRSSTSSAAVLTYFRQRVAAEFRPNMATYNLILQSFCAKGEMVLAEELFRIMDREDPPLPGSMGHIRPDVVIFTNLVYGYLQQNDPKAARSCIDLMHSRGIRPTSITYGVVAASYLRDDASMGLDMAIKLARSFVNREVLPSNDRHRQFDLPLARGQQLLHVLGPLVDAYAQRGNAVVAAQFFNILIDREGTPSMILYTALMNAFRNAQDVENVWHLWLALHSAVLDAYPHESTSENPRPRVAVSHRRDLVVPWTIVMDAASHAGWYSRILQHWRRLDEEGFAFDASNWNSLGIAACHGRDLATAFWIGENVLSITDYPTLDFALPEKAYASADVEVEGQVEWAPRIDVVAVREQGRLYQQQPSTELLSPTVAPGHLAEALNSPPTSTIDSRSTILKSSSSRRRDYWQCSSAFLETLSASIKDQFRFPGQDLTPKRALLSAHPRMAKLLREMKPAPYSPWLSKARSEAAYGR